MVDDQHSSSLSGAAVATTARTFDVSLEADLLKLLQFIRRGPVPEAKQGALRDAILDFSNLQDTAALLPLATELAPYNVTLTYKGEPVLAAAATAPRVAEQSVTVDPQPIATSLTPVKKTSQQGHTRPKPVFSQSQSTTRRVVSVPMAPEPEAAPAPTPVRIPVVSNNTQTTAMAPEEPAVALPAVPAPAVAAPAQSISPAAPVAAASAPTVIASSSDPFKAAQERVKEIKHLINEKVGNPVNLIDSNNEVGREYMNALLQAMKTLNGGTAEEIKLSMDRLEKAFAAVETTLDSGKTVIPAPAAASGFTTAPPAPPPPPQAVAAQPAPAEPAPAPAPAPVISPSAAPIPSPISVPPPTPPVIPSVPPTAPIMTPIPTEVKVAEIVPAPTTVPSVASQTPAAAQSLAQQLEAERQAQAAKAAKQAAAPVTENTDPLKSDAVNNGLKQLLSEWALFKGGGIFGTGPSGIESPLYKNLANLPMAAVISSRFEGATPEIKQSLTDYMNGWRYEQGVVHEMNETFEHYLRRVIKVILDRKVPGIPA